MAKYWEIRESYGDKGGKSEMKEAYECGYEEGYEAAMMELERGGMGERMGHRGYMGERHSMGERDSMGERGYMGERRGRDSMGRYR
ncbi:MAG: hypothetical protein MJZ12_00325 [Prevotella sp.]|nr:hypothetical protein [Prevotella sp.]